MEIKRHFPVLWQAVMEMNRHYPVLWQAAMEMKTGKRCAGLLIIWVCVLCSLYQCYYPANLFSGRSDTPGEEKRFYMSNSNEYAPEFQKIIDQAKACGTPIRVAIAGADAENILRGVFQAQEDGFVEPILIGSYRKINNTLEKIGMTDRKFDLQPVTSDTNPVQFAIEMIQDGSADMLMRGNTQTRDFLLPVLNKANHLIRPGRLLTHIVMLKIPTYHKLLALSDVTLLVRPSIENRKDVVRNMVDALSVFGVEHPNIGLLSLIEKPAFHMRDTVEAQTIIIDHNDEPIADCNLVGPITWDLIVDKEAARLKNYDNPACGDFDGVVVQNLMTGNLIVKVLHTSTGAHNCGILIGSNIPIAITGRSETPQESYLSLAACTVMNSTAENRKKYFGQ